MKPKDENEREMMKGVEVINRNVIRLRKSIVHGRLHSSPNATFQISQQKLWQMEQCKNIPFTGGINTLEKMDIKKLFHASLLAKCLGFCLDIIHHL